jgi:hypothetical protein
MRSLGSCSVGGILFCLLKFVMYNSNAFGVLLRVN